MTKFILAAAALALCTFTGTAAANDNLPTRAASALGAAIASQGNAALVQIRQELKESALEAIKPFLPEPKKAQDPEQPAEAPAARH